MELIEFAAMHGVQSAKDGPIIPFVMTETNSKRNLVRFPAYTLEDGVRMAQTTITALLKTVKDKPLPTYSVMVFDGYVKQDGSKTDAVMVKGYDEEGRGHIFAQMYRPKGLLRPFKLLGDLQYIGEDDQNP